MTNVSPQLTSHIDQENSLQQVAKVDWHRLSYLLLLSRAMDDVEEQK
jgi:hypothetical protein